MTRPVPTWYLIAALLASTLAGLALTVAYVQFAIAREREGSERRQCELINAQVRVYDETPPSTAAGILLAETYRDLKIKNECE